MKNVIVCCGTPADAEIILNFTAQFAREANVTWFDRETTRRGITRVLSDPAQFGQYYLIVTADGDVLGMCLVSPIFDEWHDYWVWLVTSVFVRKESRRQGVCRTLLREIDALARQTGGVGELQLYVRPENPAIRVYETHGFTRTSFVFMEKPLLDT